MWPIDLSAVHGGDAEMSNAAMMQWWIDTGAADSTTSANPGAGQPISKGPAVKDWFSKHTDVIYGAAGVMVLLALLHRR